MPLFDFECKKCGQVLEDVLTHFPDIGPDCPACAEEMKRRISAHSLHKIKGDNSSSTEKRRKL